MKIGKILKYTVIAAILALLVFLSIRIFMSSDRSVLDSVYPTKEAQAAYNAKGDDAFVTYKLPYDMSEDGYYVAYSPVYNASEKEFQITIRYNDSLSENYLEGSDPKDYYFVLRDSEGNSVSKAKVVDEKERYFYNHQRLSFKDVEVGNDTELYLFLCCDECSYPAKHTEGIIVIHPSLSEKPYKLSSAEKKLLND